MASRLTVIVWDHYPEGGSEKLTALAMAEHGDPDGSNIYPATHTVAMMTEQSDRTVMRHIDRMVARGWLVMVEERGGRHRPNIYRMPIENIPEAVRGKHIKLESLTDCHPFEVGNPDKRVTKTTLKGDKRVTKTGINPDTAMSPDLLTKTIDQDHTPHALELQPPSNGKTNGKKPHFVLPDWVPKEHWDAWVEARTKVKKPPTEYAKKLAVLKLDNLREQGYAPAQILMEAAFNNWAGLFPPKEAR
jgi:hypothetical protein